MLRLSLIVAILVGLGALYFTHFNVAEKISTLTSDLETSIQDAQSARDAEAKARAAERQAQEELDQANRELSQKTAALETTSTRLAEQEKRANELSEQLTQTRGQLNSAREELAQWRALGIPVDQIRAMQTELRETKELVAVYEAEKESLSRSVSSLQARLTRYEGPPKVPLPEGLKGSVVAVDPKYRFVVLDIGENQGVRQNGEMLINREGRLIGKVQITRIHPDSSIANVIPEWKRDEVMEGDQVINQ